MSTELRVGDRVRIKYEGEVLDGTDKLKRTVRISPYGVGYIAVCDVREGVATVEVLERAKPKVGDMVHGAELDALPEGSVIRQVLGGVVYNSLWFRGQHGWFGMVDKQVITDRPFSHYRVEYIPEPTP